MPPEFPRDDSHTFSRGWEGASPSAWPARKSPASARRSDCGRHRSAATSNARRRKPPTPAPPAQVSPARPRPEFRWRHRQTRPRGRDHGMAVPDPVCVDVHRTEFYSQLQSRRTAPPRRCRRVTQRAVCFSPRLSGNSIDSPLGRPYHEIEAGSRKIGGIGHYRAPNSPFMPQNSAKLIFWGVRGSTPTLERDTWRYGGNTACLDVDVAGGPHFILDCGTGLRMLGNHLHAHAQSLVALAGRWRDRSARAGDPLSLGPHSGPALLPSVSSKPKIAFISTVFSPNISAAIVCGRCSKRSSPARTSRSTANMMSAERFFREIEGRRPLGCERNARLDGMAESSARLHRLSDGYAGGIDRVCHGQRAWGARIRQ